MPVANGIGRQHADGGVGVDAGAGHEVAVGAAVVPRHRLAHEAVDDALAERAGDPPLRRAGQRAAHDDPGRRAPGRCR